MSKMLLRKPKKEKGDSQRGKRNSKTEEYIQQKYKLFPFKSYVRINKTKNPNQQGT